MAARTIMVQGTASNVGKSILVAALCRIMRQDGIEVAPFKAQNMALNSFVTVDGGEMGRAQVVQAEAAGVVPSVDMNPILLKPEADNRAQVIVRGKPLKTQSAREYYSLKAKLWRVVRESLRRLLDEYEVVVIEGAGSPAEINLKDNDIVNMKVARYCRSPVVLVADIDRGGVFASLVGTLELLEPAERALVKALVINKFRGDLSLLTPGLKWLEAKTGLPVAGVIPYYHDIHIAEEDSVPLEKRRRVKARAGGVLDIAVVRLPHLSNFDDFDPLEREAGVRLRYVEPGEELGQPDLVLLPGTKSTVADLAALRRSGMADKVLAAAWSGVPVIGICGGYQMLGEAILDPQHIEGRRARVRGLGLLPVTTSFMAVKSTRQVSGRVTGRTGLLVNACGLGLNGYEIHMGQTASDESAPFVIEPISGPPHADGCQSADGRVLGTYLHGLFHNTGLRRAILGALAEGKGVKMSFTSDISSKEDQYDSLAGLVRRSLDMGLIYGLIGRSNVKTGHGRRK